MQDHAARSTLPGILFAIGGTVVASLNDLTVKMLSGDYPLHEVMLIRALVGIAVVLAVTALSRRGLRQLLTRRLQRHLLRVAIVMVSNVTYFLGLSVLPLSDAVAIGFVAPVLLTLMSIVVLGEKVGPHRWAAVGAGLLGVMVMVRPGAGAVSIAAVLVVISALCYACAQMMTRQMRETESAMAFSFYVQCGFIVVSSAMGLWAGDGHLLASVDPSFHFLVRPWIWPVASDWPVFLTAGLSIGLGGLMVSQAYRLNEAALVAPFEYVAMPMAIVWGAVIFGQWPDSSGWAGIALICGAGLYTIWRETVRGRGIARDAAGSDL